MSDDYDVTEAMIIYGGSFACGLGRLYLLADEDNRRRLREAFPEIFARYQEMATIRNQQQQAAAADPRRI